MMERASGRLSFWTIKRLKSFDNVDAMTPCTMERVSKHISLLDANAPEHQIKEVKSKNV